MDAPAQLLTSPSVQCYGEQHEISKTRGLCAGVYEQSSSQYQQLRQLLQTVTRRVEPQFDLAGLG